MNLDSRDSRFLVFLVGIVSANLVVAKECVCVCVCVCV